MTDDLRNRVAWAIGRHCHEPNGQLLLMSEAAIAEMAKDAQAEIDAAVVSAANAAMAAAYEDAAQVLEERGSDGWAENVMAEYTSVMAKSIRARSSVSCANYANTDALEAVRQEERVKALREAADMLQLPENGTAGDPQDQVDRLIDEDRRMIRRAILALITSSESTDTDKETQDD